MVGLSWEKFLHTGNVQFSQNVFYKLFCMPSCLFFVVSKKKKKKVLRKKRKIMRINNHLDYSLCNIRLYVIHLINRCETTISYLSFLKKNKETIYYEQ